MTNLQAWLASGDEINTPRARRIRELAGEAERERMGGNAAGASELEDQARRLLDYDMDLRRSLRAALFELSAAIRAALAGKPADCECDSPAQAYSSHPEMRPLLDDVTRLQRQADELFLQVHRDNRMGPRT